MSWHWLFAALLAWVLVAGCEKVAVEPGAVWQHSRGLCCVDAPKGSCWAPRINRDELVCRLEDRPR